MTFDPVADVTDGFLPEAKHLWPETFRASDKCPSQNTTNLWSTTPC